MMRFPRHPASGCRGKSLEVVNSVGNQENLNENLLSPYQLQEGTVDSGKFVFPGNCFSCSSTTATKLRYLVLCSPGGAVLLAAGSPRGSWRFVCKPPLQKRSGSAVGGGPWVHPATLVGWMSQLHHSSSSAESAHIPLPNTAAQQPFQLSHWSGKDGIHAN